MIEHVDPVGPRAGLQDQREAKDAASPSCGPEKIRRKDVDFKYIWSSSSYTTC